MDPITAIGTAGAIANMIDVVSKAIKSLRDLCDRWKDAGFTILNLIAQLTALRAALTKIQEWIDSDLAGIPQHHQLVMDLDLSVTCCRMLINRIDAQVSELDRTAGDTLDVRSKIRVVFGAKAIEDLQKAIERQIGALTLLLTACNCKTISEQKALLEKSSSRKIFNQVTDDSSSLFVLHGTTSSYSRWTKYTDNLSKISMAFQFDRELFISKVYERAIRGFAKDSIRRHEEVDMGLSKSPTLHVTKLELKKQTERSRAVDHEIDEQNRIRRRECRILLLGDTDSGRAIVRHMKYGNCDLEELLSYRDRVRTTALKAMCTVLEGLKESQFKFENEHDQKHAATVLWQYQSDPTEMNVEVGESISSLWRSLGEAWSNGTVDIADGAT
ncbi:hypothetical protein GP486_003753 [Trichoglossum hirsutum]|uniref:Fungal N-terminal domain-containing protein n=1 Tax=Trichoglossum hirsutum TaxID=265104 RepID=A0A9P8LCB8_9PEZI|nr:hypothetical protein GP486_003753 [Trichoglossum hirsutum]